MSGDEDVTYVHRPGEESGESESSAESTTGGSADADDRNLGRKGWILVGSVVVSTLVIPGLVYLFPATLADAGVPFFVAFLVLPFVPAVILGGVAVWAMTGAGAGAKTDASEE